MISGDFDSTREPFYIIQNLRAAVWTRLYLLEKPQSSP